MAPGDKCEEHPGVKWYGDRPCFVCQPEAWADTLAEPTGPQYPLPPSDGGVAATIREMVESGHWPPMQVVLSRVPEWNGDEGA